MALLAAIDNEHRLNSLYMIDLLIIAKLIESYTNKPISKSYSFYGSLREDYISYDDFYWPLHSFFEETTIGEMETEDEFCEITIFSLQECYKKWRELSSSQQIKLVNLTESFIKELDEINKSYSFFEMKTNFIEDTYTIAGSIMMGDFAYHRICEVILKYQLKYMNFLEGTI